jgi:hypothetical protein
MHHLECAKHFACRHEQKVAKSVQCAEPSLVNEKAAIVAAFKFVILSVFALVAGFDCRAIQE